MKSEHLTWENVISADYIVYNELLSTGMASSEATLKDLSNKVTMFCYMLSITFEEIAKNRGHELSETHNK